MEIKTPEEVLRIKNPKMLWHHGVCDLCKKRLILVLHLGYDTQPKRDYRICKNCIKKHIEYILFGKEQYKDSECDRR